MQEIKKIKIDLQKIISAKFESLSPYLIPEFYIISTDPISEEETITFQYFNEEEGLLEKLQYGIDVAYGKSTKKILSIKNLNPDNFMHFNHLKELGKYSNSDLIIKIIENHFLKKKIG
jgi:hypothetical protein